jgi:hypothetical protein
MTREEKIILWSLGAANDMRDEGLATGDFPKMTPEGLKAYLELIRSGYIPTLKEMADSVAYMEDNFGMVKTKAGDIATDKIMENLSHSGMDN